MGIDLRHGDCLDVMAGLDEASIDSIVTDPPYELGFMGRKWDASGVAFDPRTWAAALRVLKPGGHLVAFGAPKNYHRLACAIEDAGFEIRDSLMWVFGSGFPKSLDVSKAIDKAAGAARALTRPGVVKRDGYGEDWDTGSSTDRPRYDDPATPEAADWQGWGTALKPAYEPIILARKPLIGTVAETVLAHGTGALNIDACRVATDETITATRNIALGSSASGVYGSANTPGVYQQNAAGRWPANLVHDGSEEVLAGFPVSKDGVAVQRNRDGEVHNEIYGAYRKPAIADVGYGGGGSAARFFYCAKASKIDRAGSKHPTVKPIALMRWLVRMVTPPGGVVLDPFAGSGTTGEAARIEGFNAMLIEREDEYMADIKRRLNA